MKRTKVMGILLACALLVGGICPSAAKGKTILIPEKQKKENRFGQTDGNFSYEYKAESENLVLFWEKSFGKNPEQYFNKSRRFYPDEILREGERFYTYYTDKLKFADRTTSNASKYKMIIWMFNDDETTAYGWGDEGVGMMWMRPCRTNAYPYCALAHEMGHSFQYMTEADGARGFSGSPLVEYTSQWMLWQVYPSWVTLEKFHLDAYMKQTHYSLLNGENQYHAPQFLEYWSYRHGLDFIARLWKEAEGTEDPVSAYKRLTGVSQEQFNDEVYDAASRFVTWDLPRVKASCSSYANQHSCKMEGKENGWMQIAQSRSPQNYGYNAIRLSVPEGGTEVRLDFEGIAGSRDFHNVHPDKAGWRYGFVAVTTEGKRVYGNMNRGENGMNRTASFSVPQNTQFLWLVVTGAPTAHWETHRNGEKKGEETQWSYRIRLDGTSVHPSVLK